MLAIPARGGDGIGLIDVAFGTPWYFLIPGLPFARPRLTFIQIDNGGTANGIYVMRPLAASTFQGAFGTGTATVVVKDNLSPPNDTFAAGDQVVYQDSSGVWRQAQCLTWTPSTLTLVLTANLAGAVVTGNPIFNLGIYTDTDWRTGRPFPKIHTPTSAVKEYNYQVGFGAQAGEPLLLYCPNAGANTKVTQGEYGYEV